ncbi:hypothetical protein [Streptomyces sp. NBC_00019]
MSGPVSHQVRDAQVGPPQAAEITLRHRAAHEAVQAARAGQQSDT